MTIIERIETLFLCRGQQVRVGEPPTRLSVFEHALQTAQLAEWDGADEPLVAAAFLHDIGRLLPTPPGTDTVDDVHELRAVAWLAESFPSAVIEPIRLHVQAKRYLASGKPAYLARMSAAAREELDRQGGPMTVFERGLFEELPYAIDAIRVRHWDDVARQPGRRTAPLAWYLHVVAAQELGFAARSARIEIASASVS